MDYNKNIYLRKIKILKDEFGKYTHCHHDCDYCDAIMDAEEYHWELFENILKELEKWKKLEKGLGYKTIFSFLKL